MEDNADCQSVSKFLFRVIIKSIVFKPIPQLTQLLVSSNGVPGTQIVYSEWTSI